MEIAKGAGAKVFHRELNNWGAQRNWGLNQCQHPWILVVDCDEILSTELLESLAAWKIQNSKKAYHIPLGEFIFFKAER